MMSVGNKAELIAEQLLQGNLNKKTWGTIGYNAIVEGVIEGGVTDTTAQLQLLVNKAISEGRRTIFLPHITNGQYRVTTLTNADQVDFVGDNSSFVGGYTGTISGLGGFAEHLADYAKQVGMVFNVKGYGAVGDSIADDTAAIQAAIDSVPYRGGIVFFPPGYYKITSELFVSRTSGSGGITFTGAGKNASVIVPSTATQNGFHIVSWEPVVFRDLSIFSNIAKTAGAGILIEGPIGDDTKSNQNSRFDSIGVGAQYRCIQFSEASYFTITGCRIGEYGDAGLYVENTVNADEGDSNISDTLIIEKDSSSVNGIYYKSSGGLKLNNVKILGGKYGFKMDVANGAATAILLFSGCSIENCTDRGIILTRSGTGTFVHVVIDGCQLSNSDRLIDIPTGGVSKYVISNNVLNIKSTGIAMQVIDSVGGIVSGNLLIGAGSTQSAAAFAGTAEGIFRNNEFNNVINKIYNASTTSMNIELEGTAAPTVDTWRVGDKVVNTNVTEQGTAGSKYIISGWVCISSGTPGTWVPMRCLTGN